MSKKLLFNTLNSNSLNLNIFSKRQFLLGLFFIKFFKKLLLVNHIILLTNSFFIKNNLLYFNFVLYFQGSALLRFRKKSSFIFCSKKFNFIKLINSIFRNFKNCVFIRCFNANKFFFINNNKQIFINFYKKLKFFNFSIFPRRFKIFIDFLKICTLFLKGIAKVNTFLFFICLIFKILRKGTHNKFFYFLRTLFNLFFSNEFKLLFFKKFIINGLRLVINGRIKGKSRASSVSFLYGINTLQTIKNKISYSKRTVFSKYGTFGFKLWVCYN